MAITSVPTVLSSSTDVFINAGMTSRIQAYSALSGSLTVNPTSGGFIRILSPSGALAVSFTGIPAGYSNVWYIEVNNKLAQTLTFSGVTWDGGSAPTLASAANKSSLLQFFSPDGGTTIYGKMFIASA